MASISTSSSSSLVLPQEHESIDPELLRVLVILINQHIDSILSNSKTRKILRTKCTSNLKTHKQDFFEFSEQSVLSNLYWGIENVEAAIQSKWHEDKNSCLKNAEKMLQAPALLNENGITAGFSNSYLVSCSYYYLSIVRKLQGDELQAAIHFLQALLVSPRHVRTEFAPELYRSIFRSCIVPLRPELGNGRRDFEENEATVEGVKWGARSYKAWLMYHQVISYGQTPLLMREPDDNSEQIPTAKACHTSSSNSYGHQHLDRIRTHQNFEKVHPIDPQEKVTPAMVEGSVLERVADGHTQKRSSIKRLQDILLESDSDSPTSLCSCSSDSADGDSENQDYADEFDRSLRNLRGVEDELEPESDITSSQAPKNRFYKEVYELKSTRFSSVFSGSSSELDFSNCSEEVDEEEPTWESFQICQKEYRQGSSARTNEISSYLKSNDEITLCPEENYRIEQAEILEKVISKLCFSGLGKCDDDSTVEIVTIYEMLASKSGLKYSLLKDVILDQLLMAISTSKEEGVTRASVSILSSIISGNRSVTEDIKRKGLRLCDLANALKRNVYEAATLIYLINPSPAEIKTLELLPTLIEIICTSNCYKSGLKTLFVTPPSASLKIIEVLVSAFDFSTNNTHLAAISSQKVLSCLLNVPRNDNLEESLSLAAILVRCMKFDGQCRNYISQFTPISLLISLILSNQERATFVGLEFFHELLRMPRSSAVSVLQQIREGGGINIMCVLLLAIQQTQDEYKLLAASLLLQLDVLEHSPDIILNREVAVEALLESLTCEENPTTQQLSAFILANLGGTYAWTGEPYTIAWLVRKAGLSSLQDKNIVKNIDWSDNTLQESGIEIWCSKVARHIIKLGNPVFHALEKGLRSKNKRVCKDCLTAIAWLGCEIVKGPEDLRCSACDILLSTIEQYVHPGMELEERLLSCLCLYNYTFGRGMQKLIKLSEGIRESLRRLSSISWMADELLKVADYYIPNKWRISCVHTQVLEANHNGSGAVSSLIYYRGQLFSGYADGSIKVWDIKGQTTTLVSDVKEHKKAVTCFSLFEPGNCLLSGSSDKTIRIWQVVETKLQCVEVIATKEPIRSLETSGELLFAVTHSHKMKVFDSLRKVKDLCKNKHVKCIKASQGKVYIGCMDSSIQELTIGNNRQQEIKASSKSWRMQNKPINSIALYKDWLYSASTCVDGSRIKDWRRQSKAQLSIVPEKRANVAAMSIVEDFIYLNCSSSASNLEIWLRGTQHKVGRLSAGSKITSLLTANDMVLCGTEAGLIKGWIPL